MKLKIVEIVENGTAVIRLIWSVLYEIDIFFMYIFIGKVFRTFHSLFHFRYMTTILPTTIKAKIREFFFRRNVT